MLLRCCYIHIDLVMSYLCDLFFIFSHIFISINHITSFKQTYAFFIHLLLFLDDNVGVESE